MNIHSILNEMNESNSLNHKREVLKKYKDNDLFMEVLNKTYDQVKWTYGVSLKQIVKFNPQPTSSIDLETALDILANELCTRNKTGHSALQLCSNTIDALTEEDADVFKKIINRDLRINIGKTEINKIVDKKWKCVRPSYMRCDTYSKKTAKHINFPAYIQLKADGTYREITKDGDDIKPRTRSGEEHSYPLIEKSMENDPDGVTCGELTVAINADNVDRLMEMFPKRAEAILNAYDNGDTVLDRATGNGMINSDKVPQEDLIYDVWDFITLEEYAQAAKKDRKNPCQIPYSERFKRISEIVKDNKHINVIECHVVENLQEALKYCSDWMANDFEGGVLKDFDGVFKDGTSKYQLKLKLEIDCEMRITGFKDGTPGTKREGKIGSILFENDEGTIKGKTSGFSDKELDDFTENQDKILGKIMTVQFNDLIKASSNDYYALSHPRFMEFRDDKDTTDTLEQVQKYREMAMELS